MRTRAPRASLELNSTLGAWPVPGGVCPPHASFRSALRTLDPPTKPPGARYVDARDVIELRDTRDRTESLLLSAAAITSRSSS